MVALSPWCPWRALLLLVLLLPLELGLAEGGDEPASAPALSGVLSLPLMQVLLSQAPPRSRARRQAGGPPLRYMLDLYRRVADRHGRPRQNFPLTTNTVRLVRPFAKTRRPGAGPWLTWSLNYRVEVQVPWEHLAKIMAVYLQTHSSAHGPFWCTAELLSSQDAEPPAAPPPAHLKVTVPSTTTASVGDSWVEMDLTADLHPWIWEAQKSWVLHLSHACSSLRQPDPGWEDAVTPDDPFLMLFINDSGKYVPNLGAWRSFYAEPPGRPAQTRKARKARQAGGVALNLPGRSRGKQGGAWRGECALRPFRVSFKELGWEHWIIAPPWYRPQYCKGDCPNILRFGFNSPNHAIIQNLINELVDQTVPRPSCVPYEYRPITLLMVEPDGSVILKVSEDMIAKSCTCR